MKYVWLSPFLFSSWWKEFWRTVSSLVSCGGKTNSSIQLWKLSEHSDCIHQSVHQQGYTHSYHNKVRTYHSVVLKCFSTIMYDFTFFFTIKRQIILESKIISIFGNLFHKAVFLIEYTFLFSQLVQFRLVQFFGELMNHSNSRHFSRYRWNQFENWNNLNVMLYTNAGS